MDSDLTQWQWIAIALIALKLLAWMILRRMYRE